MCTLERKINIDLASLVELQTAVFRPVSREGGPTGAPVNLNKMDLFASEFAKFRSELDASFDVQEDGSRILRSDVAVVDSFITTNGLSAREVQASASNGRIEQFEIFYRVIDPQKPLDIMPLADLDQLKQLQLKSENPLKTLKPLEALQSLEALSLGSQTFDSAESLRRLTNLQSLDLFFSLPLDLDLSALTKLQSLKLRVPYQASIEWMRDLPCLTKVELIFFCPQEVQNEFKFPPIVETLRSRGVNVSLFNRYT